MTQERDGSRPTERQRIIARAREAFLDDGVHTPGIREATMRAWHRSKAAGVPATGAPRLVLGIAPDGDSALMRAVRPVTDSLMAQFAGSQVGMMVTDRDARIVARWITGSAMRGHLDRMGVYPGAIFDESHVGSTGLGTALEDSRPVVVEGAEHFNDSFDAVVAVGAPIVHPGTGTVEGVIDVVCPIGAPVAFMLPIVAQAAREAGEHLVSGYAREDRALLDAFLRHERRGARRPVIAINGRMLFANAHVGGMLALRPHAELWERVQKTIADDLDSTVLSTSADGVVVGLVRAVSSADGQLGAILQLSSTVEEPVRRRSRAGADLVAELKATLPGDSLRWTAAVDSAARAAAHGERLLLAGPVGSGKTALATTLARRIPGRPDVDVLDAARAVSDPPSGNDPVVVEDLHVLDDDDRERLCRWLDGVGAGAPVIGTVRLDTDSDGVDPVLAARFENIVAVPGLVHRAADIGQIAAVVLATSPHRARTLEPAAVRELAGRSWPGNVAQLRRVLDTAAARCGERVVRAEDLPGASGRATGPRRLSYLEMVERDAIAALLDAAGGGKSEVARELGISRSTLYRKLTALGLDDH